MEEGLKREREREIKGGGGTSRLIQKMHGGQRKEKSVLCEEKSGQIKT